jgi:transposase-like protein
MNPNELFCLNASCPAKGQAGQGNIQSHSQQEERCICTVCGDTFSASKGTLFYRLRTEPAVVILVLTLLAYGCPTQAAAIALDLDERTIKSWWQRAGVHCESFHQYMVSNKQLDLQQVQADEIKVKQQGGWCWMALALMVSTRLWLGGVVAEKRDSTLIQRLVIQIKPMALCRPLLLAVDGFAAYVSAFQDAFRASLPRFGQPGRPKLVAWPHVVIVQVVKRRLPTGLDIERRIVQGSATLVAQLLRTSQGALGVINTAYIERFNATMRQRLHWLSRRSRSLAQQTQTLHAAMFIVGCLYNFCDYHDSLRVKLALGERSFRWVQRTPALASGLTDHRWAPTELFSFPVPPQRWSPPRQRGRPSQELIQLIQRWC